MIVQRVMVDPFGTSGGTTDPTKLPLDGSVAMRGTLQMAGFTITGLGNPVTPTDAVNLQTMSSAISTALSSVVYTTDPRLSNARAPTSHASTHLPNGSDALTTAAAVALTPGGSNSAGIANSFIRSDHTHALPAFGTVSGTFAEGNDGRIVNAVQNSRNLHGTSPIRINGTGSADLSSDVTVSINIVNASGPGYVTTIANAPSVLMSYDGNNHTWGKITDAYVSSSAAIAVTKLATGSSNQFITSNGIANSWSAMSDTLHDARGGGTQHAVVTGTTAGFAPGMGTANRVLVTTDGNNATWDHVTSSMISSCEWSTLTGVPDATTGQKGIVQLAGDLQGSATSPTVKSLTGTGGVVAMAVPVLRVSGMGMQLQASGDTQGTSNIYVRNQAYANGATIENASSDAVLFTFATGTTFPANSAGNAPAIVCDARNTGPAPNGYTINAGEMRLGKASSPSVIFGYDDGSNKRFLRNQGTYEQVELSSIQSAVTDAHITQGLDGRVVTRLKGDYGSFTVVPKAYEQNTANAPRFDKQAGGFSLTGQTATKTLTFPIAIHGQWPGNITNAIVGTFLIGWMGNGTLTNGGAKLFLFTAGLGNTGTVASFNLTAASTNGHLDCLPGGMGDIEVTASNTTTTFSIIIRASSAQSSDVTRFVWKTEYGWAPS